MRSGLVSGLSVRSQGKSSLLAGGGGGVPYVASATNFDGTNDYIQRTLTSAVDGSLGTLSFWMNLNGGDGGEQFIFRINGGTSYIYRTAANKINIYLGDNGAALKVGDTGATSLTAASGWAHILASWDVSSGTTLFDWYINDVQELSGAQTVNSGLIDYDGADLTIGARQNGTLKLNACISEFYFHQNHYLDLSVVENRRKFITAGGAPVDLGPTGSLPTSSQPIIYLPNPFGTFEQNAGYDGDFTVIGALTECASAPA